MDLNNIKSKYELVKQSLNSYNSNKNLFENSLNSLFNEFNDLSLVEPVDVQTLKIILDEALNIADENNITHEDLNLYVPDPWGLRDEFANSALVSNYNNVFLNFLKIWEFTESLWAEPWNLEVSKVKYNNMIAQLNLSETEISELETMINKYNVNILV